MKAHVRASQPKLNLLLIILLSAAFIGTSGTSWAQTTIFSENMGILTTGGPYSISSNTFQNSSTLTYSGTGDIRTSPSSVGTYTGASGGELANLNTTNGLYFQIANISTVGYTNLLLSFGVYRTDPSTADFSLKLEYSTDGITYYPIAASLISSQTGTGWRYLSNLTLGSDAAGVSNLRLRWTQTTTNPSATSIRIDDVTLSGVSTAPAIVPSPASLTGLNYVLGNGPSTAKSFTITAANLTAGGGTITATAPANYEVSTTSATTGFGSTASLTYTGTGTISPNTVWVRLAAGLAGGNYSGNVILTGGGASANVSVSGTVTVPAPTITSLSPSSVVAGSGAQTLTINGTNFINGTTTAKFNGTTKPVTYVSSTQITIPLAAADVSTPGTYAVTVTNTGNATTPSVNFAVTPATPTITSLSPPFAIVGSGAQMLTINGTNFYNGPTTAKFNGTTKPVTYVSSTQITIPLTAADVNTLGSFSVAVTNTGNGTTAISTFYVSPANNACSGAIPITVDAAAISGTMLGASPDFSNGNKDVWYAVTPTVTGTFQVTTSTTGQNLDVSVYSAACPATAGASSLVVSGTGTSTTTETVTFSGTANTTYYIRVYYSTGTQGSFTIQATQLLPPVVTSETVTRTIGVSTNYQIQATNSPTSYTATSLPPGLSSFSSTTGLISGTPTAIGTYSTSVSATNAAGTGNGTITFIIVKQDQTITFNPFPVKLTSDTLFKAGASASSGLLVTYTSSNPAVATLSNDTIQIQGVVGTTVITASQAGDATFYNAAPQVQQTLTVTQGTDLLAAWDFQTTTNGGTAIRNYSTNPLLSTQNVFKSNLDSGVLYVDGTNGSDNWYNQPPKAVDVNKTELNAFEGTANNAVYGLSTWGGNERVQGSIAFVNGNANGVAAPSAEGKSAVFRFDMSKHKNLVISYATQRTGTGFTTQTWSYSTDGINWTTAQTITNLPLNFGTITLNPISALDFASAAYLRVTFTGATTNNNGNNRFDNIRLNAISGVAPAFTTQPSNAASICAGTASTSTLTVAASGDPAPTYQWQYSATGATNSFANVANNTPAGFTYSGAMTAILTVQTSTSAAPGQYYYRSLASNVIAGNVPSNSATLTINPLPTATVTANSPYACQGNGGSFTITGTANSTVYYNLNGGPTQSVLLTSGSAPVPLGTIFSSTTITLTSVVASGTNCPGTPSGAGSTATITAVPLPASYTVTGGGFYCTGGMGVVVGLGNSDAGVNYQLFFDNGSTTVPAGSPVAGNTGNPISFGKQTGIGTYTVQATNSATGCQITGASSVTVDYYTPTSISSGPAPASQTVCQNSTPADLDVTAAGGGTLTYEWFSNSSNNNTGGTSVSGNTTQHTYSPSTAAPGTLYYYVTATGACGTVTSSTTVSVTVTSQSTASFTQSTYSTCSNTNLTLAISGTPNTTITYQINGSGAYYTTPINNTGSGNITTNNLTTGSSASTYTYTITDVSASGSTCDNSTSGSSTTITVNPLPDAGTITTAPAGANYVVLNGSTITVSDGASGGVWSTDNGNVSLSGTTPGQKTATAVSTGPVVISYTLTDGKGCVNSASRPLTVTAAYITQNSGAFSVPATWQHATATNRVSDGTTPASGGSVEVQHALTLDVDYTTGSYFAITSGSMEILPNVIFSSTGGTINFNSKSVSVRSTSAGTGAIGQIVNTTIANADNVMVERYTDAGNNTLGRRAWRLVTSPITDKTIHQTWQEGHVYITGGSGNVMEPAGYGTLITGESLSPSQAATNGFDYVGGGNHTSIKYYNNTVNPDGTWDPILTNNTANGTGILMQNQPAYMLFVRGDRTVHSTTGSGITTLRAAGSLNQLPVSVTVDHTKNYTLVGNPYASPINFETIYNNSSGITSQFIVWNSQEGQFGAYNTIIRNGINNYSVVPFNTTTPQPNATAQFIQSGSGFFVSPSGATNGSVVIGESAKNTVTTGGVSTFREVPQVNRLLWVNLNLKDNDTSITVADGILERFDDVYASDIDADDTRKQANFNENLGIFHNGSNLMVESRPDVQKTDTVQLRLWNVVKRNYQFQVKADNFTPAPGVQAWIVDNYLNTKQGINLSGNVTTVNFSVTADSGSWKPDRFMIVFQNNSAVLPVTLTSVKAAPQNGGVNVSWTVTNEVNIKQYTIEKSTDGGRTFIVTGTPQAAKNNSNAAITAYSGFDAEPQAGDNLYRIRVEAKDGSVSYSSVVKVTIGNGDGTIQIVVYPNPVRGGKVTLQLSNLKPGNYLVSLYSETGQTVYQRKIAIGQAAVTQTEELRLGNSLAQGSYQLRVTDSQGSFLQETNLIIGR